jgi:hypothetical protein
LNITHGFKNRIVYFVLKFGFIFTYFFHFRSYSASLEVGLVPKTVNTKIVAFQTHILGGSSLILSEQHINLIHILFITFSSILNISYTTSKADTIGGNPKSVKITSGESDLISADLGITPIGWQEKGLWRLPKRSIET